MTILRSEVIRAARALLRWEQRDLARLLRSRFRPSSALSSKPGILEAHTSTVAALTRAFENAGVEFIDENGGGPGLRLRKRQRAKKPK